MINVSIKNKGGNALRALENQIKKTRYTITLGFYSTATYPAKQNKKMGVTKAIPVPVVARANNYGYINPNTGVKIPPRPFLTTMPHTHGKQWKQLFRKVTATHVDLKNYKPSLLEALKIVGEQLKSDLQTNITEWKTPPNSPITIALKNGKDNPLIHEGFLRAAATYKVIIT